MQAAAMRPAGRGWMPTGCTCEALGPRVAPMWACVLETAEGCLLARWLLWVAGAAWLAMFAL